MMQTTARPLINGIWCRSARRVRLKNLREGAIFVTEDGHYAIKSEYHHPYRNDGKDPRCLCILLESGEYAAPENDDLVYEVFLVGITDRKD